MKKWRPGEKVATTHYEPMPWLMFPVASQKLIICADFEFAPDFQHTKGGISSK